MHISLNKILKNTSLNPAKIDERNFKISFLFNNKFASLLVNVLEFYFQSNKKNHKAYKIKNLQNKTLMFSIKPGPLSKRFF